MKEKKKLKKIAAKTVKLTFHQGKVNVMTAEEVIRVLKTLPRAQAIYAISKFLKGLRRRGGGTTAVIESATPVSRRQLGNIVKNLSREHVVTEVRNQINPQILGGIKVKIGDTILDYSILDRISQVGRVIQS